MAQKIWWMASVVFLLNLPFGFWRAGTRKFSVPWFLAIHAPVPVVAAIRILGGLGWHLLSFACLATAFFLGQFLGGKLRALWQQMP